MNGHRESGFGSDSDSAKSGTSGRGSERRGRSTASASKSRASSYRESSSESLPDWSRLEGDLCRRTLQARESERIVAGEEKTIKEKEGRGERMNPIELGGESDGDDDDDVMVIEESEYLGEDYQQQNSMPAAQMRSLAAMARDLNDDEEFSTFIIKRAPALPTAAARRPIRKDRSSSPEGEGRRQASEEDVGTASWKASTSMLLLDEEGTETQKELRQPSLPPSPRRQPRPRPRPSYKSTAAASQREVKPPLAEKEREGRKSVTPMAPPDDCDDNKNGEISVDVNEDNDFFFRSQLRSSPAPTPPRQSPSISSSCAAAEEEEEEGEEEGEGEDEEEEKPPTEEDPLPSPPTPNTDAIEPPLPSDPALYSHKVLIDADETDMLDAESCSNTSKSCLLTAEAELPRLDEKEKEEEGSAEASISPTIREGPEDESCDSLPFYPDSFTCLTNGADCDFFIDECKTLDKGHFLCRATYAGHSHGKMTGSDDASPRWHDAQCFLLQDDDDDRDEKSIKRDDNDALSTRRYFERREEGDDDEDEGWEGDDGDWHFEFDPRFVVEDDEPVVVPESTFSRSASLDDHHYLIRRRASSASSAHTPLPTPPPPMQYVWTSNGQVCGALHNPIMSNVPLFSEGTTAEDGSYAKRSFYTREGIGTPKKMESSPLRSISKMNLGFLLRSSPQQ